MTDGSEFRITDKEREERRRGHIIDILTYFHKKEKWQQRLEE